MEQMHDVQLTTSETIDSYYGRMEDILLRLPPKHGFNDEMEKSIFIRGLIPLRAYIKEIELATLDAAYQRANFFENSYTSNNESPLLSYVNLTQVKANQNLPSSIWMTYSPQVDSPSTIKIPMLPANFMPSFNPPMASIQRGNQLVNDGGGQKNDVLLKKIEELSHQMGELQVHVVNSSN